MVVTRPVWGRSVRVLLIVILNGLLFERGFGLRRSSASSPLCCSDVLGLVDALKRGFAKFESERVDEKPAQNVGFSHFGSVTKRPPLPLRCPFSPGIPEGFPTNAVSFRLDYRSWEPWAVGVERTPSAAVITAHGELSSVK